VEWYSDQPLPLIIGVPSPPVFCVLWGRSIYCQLALMLHAFNGFWWSVVGASGTFGQLRGRFMEAWKAGKAV
jgi:hypothetical protein